jgi:hypothetical protein
MSTIPAAEGFAGLVEIQRRHCRSDGPCVNACEPDVRRKCPWLGLQRKEPQRYSICPRCVRTSPSVRATWSVETSLLANVDRRTGFRRCTVNGGFARLSR